MSKMFIFLVFLLSTAISHGQGRIYFFNTSSTLITTSSVSGGPATGPTSGPRGSYYFGLFMAPPGTVDPSAFTFTGAYGSNLVVAGGFSGDVATVQAEVGSYQSFLVRGWSANIGRDWDTVQNYLANSTFIGWYGESQIATVMVGGDLPPPSHLFGTASGLIPGFNLDMVPEPSALVLGGLGFGVFLLLRRRVRQR